MIFKNNLGFVLSVKINAQFKAKDLIIALRNSFII